MEYFVQVTISGLTDGAIFALVALSFLVLFKATGLFSFAGGAFLTLAAYVAIWGVDRRLPLIAAYLLAIALISVLGLVMERVTIAPVGDRGMMPVVLVTFGVAFVIQTAYQVWEGPDIHSLPDVFAGRSVRLGPVSLAEQRILIVVACGLLIAGTALLFQRTSFGRHLRALASDREAARLYGVPVRALSIAAWALSSGLTAVAAVLIAPLGAVDPNFGLPVLLSGMAGATLGGFGSIRGAVVGGLVIGLAQQIGGAYTLHGAYSAIWPYLLMILIIAVRPQGIFAGLDSRRL
jgi:branched-chain amino acid transport system permease protein